MRKVRLLLVTAIAAASIGFSAAPAYAVVCQEDGTGSGSCECAETVNAAWQKLFGSDLIYCLH